MDEEKPKKPPAAEDNSISMLRKDLYAKDEPEELKKRTKELLLPKQPVVRPEAVSKTKPELTNVVAAKMQRRRTLIRSFSVVGIVIGIFLIGVALTFWYRSTRQVTQSQVQVEISAPTRFTAGETINYIVTVTNKSRITWGTVDVLFTTPSGFSYASSDPAPTNVSDHNVEGMLGELKAGASETFTISGRLIGEEGATALARAEVTISPKDFPKERVVQSQTVNTVVSAIPLEISVEAGKNAAVGERIAAIIHVRNLSDTPIEGAVLKLDPPPGMQLGIEDTGFSPEFSVVDSFWRLPKIAPLGEEVRYSVLYVSGNSGDRRELGISVMQQQGDTTFTLRNITHVISITSSQVQVAQTFNNDSSGKLIVETGQRVEGVVQYKNTGSTGLTDAIVKVKFEGTGFNAASLKLNSGAYDPTTNSIVWTAASVPALQRILPGDGGTIAYSFNVLEYDKFALAPNGKNQQLIATASLDSPDLPKPTGQTRQIMSERFYLPIATDLLFGMDSFYDDGRLGITSTGPLPPQVGQQTTYTLRTRIGSSLNDVEGTKVAIVLPDGVLYTDKFYKTAGDIAFNARTNTMTWTIPLLEGLTGRAAPAPELNMQVAITPGANVRGQVIPFVQSVKATGTDSFTDAPREATIKESPTTRSASSQNGEVQ